MKLKLKEIFFLKAILLLFLPIILILGALNSVLAIAVERLGDFSNIETSTIVSLVFCGVVVVGSLFVIIWSLVKKKFELKANPYVMASFLTLNTYICTEAATGAPILKNSILFPILSLIMIYVFYLIGIVAFKKPKIYFIVISVLFNFYGALQYFVFQFRGAPIRASDIYNIASAMEISSDYSVNISFGPYVIFAAVLDLALIIFLIIKTKLTEVKLKPRLISGSGIVGGVLVLVLTANFAFNYGVDNRIIKLNFSGIEDFESYQNTGNILLFYLDIYNTRIVYPDGYSDEKAISILAENHSEGEVKRKPTVIAIMNESFADFSHLGEFETNIDYLENYKALSKNTTKGYVTVSAYGGYSCNSEFEFLSGNSMGFFPSGSAAYTQYIKTEQDSLVSMFNDLGYNTIAFAGCNRRIWNLENAYGRLQFKEKYYANTLGISNPRYVNGNISDSSMFKRITEIYESKKDDQPMFLFATTMQNHASYKIEDDRQVHLTDINNDTAEAYLSAIRESDIAIGEIIEYFSNVDEDVVIVMFGDHYPHIPDFTEELLDSSLGNLTVEQNAKLHQTPYFIWSNFESESKVTDTMSLNYLSCELMDICGLPKTDYQNYLTKVKLEIPSISSFGYMDSNGKWHRIAEKGDNANIIDEYNMVEYYKMFKQYD